MTQRPPSLHCCGLAQATRARIRKMPHSGEVRKMEALNSHVRHDSHAHLKREIAPEVFPFFGTSEDSRDGQRNGATSRAAPREFGAASSMKETASTLENESPAGIPALAAEIDDQLSGMPH